MQKNKKIILITGGAKRIGRTLVETFAARGYRVAFTYHRSKKEADALTQSLQKKGVEVRSYRAELGDLRDVQKIVRDLKDKWGVPDVLINNAADFYPTPLSRITEKDWDYFLKTNLTGAFHFSWKIGLEMKKKRQGTIINMADLSHEKPHRGFIAYSVSKAGLIGLTRSLALELAPEVRVNAIAPGPVLPPDKTSVAGRKKLAHSVPLKRLGSAEDIARAALFLAEDAPYTTGALLPVDGGLSIA